jgi:hypothetical protein
MPFLQEDCSAWHLSRGGRPSLVAAALARHLLCGVACASPCAAGRGSTRCAPRPASSERRRDVELQAAHSEPTMGLDRHGEADPAHYGIPRGRPPSRQGEAVVGASSCGLPRAGDVLYGSLCRLHKRGFRQHNPKPSRSMPGKPIIASVSTTRCDSVFPVSSVLPWHALKSGRITSVPARFSSATTT